MQFKSLDEITQYYQEQLDNGNAETLKPLNSNGGIPVVSKAELQEAARALKDYLFSRIKDYFDSYDPEVYERTGHFLNSLEVEPIEIDGKQTYRVFFDNSKAIRSSLWEGQPQAYLPALLDSGWQTESGWHRNIPHFGFFEGAGFITAAIDDAESDDRFKGIKIIFNAGRPF